MQPGAAHLQVQKHLSVGNLLPSGLPKATHCDASNKLGELSCTSKHHGQLESNTPVTRFITSFVYNIPQLLLDGGCPAGQRGSPSIGQHSALVCKTGQSMFNRRNKSCLGGRLENILYPFFRLAPQCFCSNSNVCMIMPRRMTSSCCFTLKPSMTCAELSYATQRYMISRCRRSPVLDGMVPQA